MPRAILVNGKPPNYDLLPPHMREGAKNYIEHGIIPGTFLYRILCNDFVHAAAHADYINKTYLLDYATWLYLDCPRGAWGSPEIVNNWAASFKEGEN